MSLPDKPGQLGDISSLIGSHKLNISNLEMAGKNPNYINFKFRIKIGKETSNTFIIVPFQDFIQKSATIKNFT